MWTLLFCYLHKIWKRITISFFFLVKKNNYIKTNIVVQKKNQNEFINLFINALNYPKFWFSLYTPDRFIVKSKNLCESKSLKL